VYLIIYSSILCGGSQFGKGIIKPLTLINTQAVPPTKSLGSITRQRPKPPPNRRMPSKASPSPSPTHVPGEQLGTLTGARLSGPSSQVTRIGGITDSTVLEDRETEINGDARSEKSEKSLQDMQEHWVSLALRCE